jgi:hypothetical protein
MEVQNNVLLFPTTHHSSDNVTYSKNMFGKIKDRKIEKKTFSKL